MSTYGSLPRAQKDTTTTIWTFLVRKADARCSLMFRPERERERASSRER
jgi:hypothetical protein